MLLYDHTQDVHALADAHVALVGNFLVLLLLSKYSSNRGLKNDQNLIVQDSGKELAKLQDKLKVLGDVDRRHQACDHLDDFRQESQESLGDVGVDGDGLKRVDALQPNDFLGALHDTDALKQEARGFLECIKVLHEEEVSVVADKQTQP